ncbi:MAG: hypothetical protein ACO3CH_09255 [Ilumatobacteraceae bacterium]
MATSKTFAVAGVSTHKDGTKIRFANDAARVKILIKNGHTDIELIDLPREMTKAEIAQYLFETDFAKGRVAVMDAIKDLAKKNRVKAVPEVSKSTTAAKAEAVTQ